MTVKNSGQVFTPDFLVSNILDYVGYTEGNILQKHVIDNSCGDGGVFVTLLIGIVKITLLKMNQFLGLKMT